MNYLSHIYASMLAHPSDVFWNSFGFLGGAIFGIRFLIQWLKSEREGHSVIPMSFWYVSLGGGMISFIYAFHQQAWPLVFQQAMPLPIYARNIWLIYREQDRESQAS